MDIDNAKVCNNKNIQHSNEEASNANIYKNNNKQIEDTKSNKNLCMSQNATNSHPLMFSPTSPISPDYPDLIPEKPKNKQSFTSYEKQRFQPEAHSSSLNLDVHETSIDKQLIDEEVTLENYNETLPGEYYKI